MDIETINELLESQFGDVPETERPLMFANPSYETAIIGLTNDDRIAYSYDRMIMYLMEKDNMSVEEAQEFIDFNTIKALPYYGDRAPVVVYDFGDE